jgi:hypothetical protein
MLELTDQQVVDLVNQLPPKRKRSVLVSLASEAVTRRDERMQLAEAQIRRLCTERGRNWDQMSEDEREVFIDELLHEDRPCGL